MVQLAHTRRHPIDDQRDAAPHETAPVADEVDDDPKDQARARLHSSCASLGNTDVAALRTPSGRGPEVVEAGGAEATRRLTITPHSLPEPKQRQDGGQESDGPMLHLNVEPRGSPPVPVRRLPIHPHGLPRRFRLAAIVQLHRLAEESALLKMLRFFGDRFGIGGPAPVRRYLAKLIDLVSTEGSTPGRCST
jgi:hypothetical protein